MFVRNFERVSLVPPGTTTGYERTLPSSLRSSRSVLVTSQQELSYL